MVSPELFAQIDQVLELFNTYLARRGIKIHPVIIYNEKEPNAVIYGLKLLFKTEEEAKEFLSKYGYEVK